MESAEFKIKTIPIKFRNRVTAEAAGIVYRRDLPLTSVHFSNLFQELRQSINWQEDYYTAFDRRFTIPRLQAWYADNGLQYRYADNLLNSQTWITPLQQLRRLIENVTQLKFNAVLATCYRNGLDYVNWHADDEKELGTNPMIASLSLGATRRFEFRNKKRNKYGNLLLRQGDFILMSPKFQRYWQHQIPAQPQVEQERINLTFRCVYSP